MRNKEKRTKLRIKERCINKHISHGQAGLVLGSQLLGFLVRISMTDSGTK